MSEREKNDPIGGGYNFHADGAKNPSDGTEGGGGGGGGDCGGYDGQGRYIDVETGELIEAANFDQFNPDFDFYKLFLSAFLQATGIISNKKTKVCFWILEHMNYHNNTLFLTQAQISEATGVSRITVCNTMKALQKADFLRKGTVGQYYINPNILFKGRREKRLNIMHRYYKVKKKEITTDDIKLRRLKESLKTIKAEIAATEASIKLKKAREKYSFDDTESKKSAKRKVAEVAITAAQENNNVPINI